MSLTSVLGGGKGGSAAASLWLGNLLVLGFKLLCWEEVFFPVKANFGNWARARLIFLSKCPARLSCSGVWPSGQIWVLSKGHRCSFPKDHPMHLKDWEGGLTFCLLGKAPVDGGGMTG